MLIADGGGGSFRRAGPVTSLVAVPKPTPRSPSATAGPRPALRVPQADTRMLRAEGLGHAQMLQQQAAALQQQIAQAQARAQQARQRANESQQQAQLALARSRHSRAPDDKSLAATWRAQAQDDEFNALQCEADANLKSKQATLEQCQRRDLQAGHASAPSRETQAAQADTGAAAATVSLLYDTPPGEADPLRSAGQTTAQCAKAEHWNDWKDAATQEIRVAGLRALTRGGDPQAAMHRQAEVIERRDVQGMEFHTTGAQGHAKVTGTQWVQSLRDAVQAESPSQAAFSAEVHLAQTAWQPLLDAAENKVTQADHLIAKDRAALAQAPGGMKREASDVLAEARRGAGEAGQNQRWWESRTDVMRNRYQQRGADLDLRRAETGYQVAVAQADPDSRKDQAAIANARDARDRAVGDQTLLRAEGQSLVTQAGVVDAQAELQAAWDAHASEQAGQVSAQTVTYAGRYGTRSTQTLYPDGYDKTFWAVPGSEEGNKHVHLAENGQYYYVGITRSGQDREALNPATARLWAAYDRLNGREASGPAQAGALAQHEQARAHDQRAHELLGGADQAPSRLDPIYWERRTTEIDGDLKAAQAGVAGAERDLAALQARGAPPTLLDAGVASLGDKVRVNEQAQRQADALQAVQRWRASPDDMPLLNSAGDAAAKATTASAESGPSLATLQADRQKALDERNTQKVLAHQPGDSQQAARDAITRLDLRIQHDDHLISQVQAHHLHAGAVHLNRQFSWGDRAIQADSDSRFSMRKDADGRAMGLDVAPPQNYENLRARATAEGDDKVLDDGTRILHNPMGWGEVWEVPLAHGMKQFIYQRDHQVFITPTLATPGVRLSAQTEQLWQRLWRADSQTAQADEAVQASSTQVEHWNQLNPGAPILAPGADSQPAVPPTAPLGLDGQPVKVPTLWERDLDKRRDDLLAHQGALSGSQQDPAQRQVVADLLQRELDAVIAMKSAQAAHRTLQQWQAGASRGAAEPLPLRDAVSVAEAQAIDKQDQWLAACRSQGLTRATDQQAAAQAQHQPWKDSHPAAVGTDTERRSTTWAALQAADEAVGVLRRQHIEAATPDAQAAQKALISKSLSFEQRNDTARLHDLFMAHPEVMAQPLMNEHDLQHGSGPLQMQGRIHLGNEVAGALGFPPDAGVSQAHEPPAHPTDLYRGLTPEQKTMRDAVVDEIVGIGGDRAQVTLLPVVYSTPQSGIVKTTLFKVQDGHGGERYVDERGAHYENLDDYRANNALPSTDCKLVMPADSEMALDRLGNVQVQVLDAHTETGWEKFKRKSHFDTVVGGAGLVLGVVMTVGSGGLLAPVAAGLLVAASAYGATTSAMSLHNRASHGLSVNPFTDQEARMDWLNLAGSALAVPTLSAATRAGLVGWQATRAAHQAGQISGRLPWLAIRGSKQTGQALANMARAEGPGAAHAAALQNRLAFWQAPARVMARPTMGVGGTGLEENTRYMADHWEAMSPEQRWEQGGMALLNLVDFASPVWVKGVQHLRPAAAGQAASAPGTPLAGSVNDRHDFSFGPEGAGLKPREVEGLRAGHLFVSPDALVGPLAHDIESMHPGLVVGVNVPVHVESAAGGAVGSDRAATDADILLRDGTILQVKSGHANGLTGQVIRTQNAVKDSAVVIGYAPESQKWGMFAEAARQGLLVTHDRQLLMDLIRPPVAPQARGSAKQGDARERFVIVNADSALPADPPRGDFKAKPRHTFKSFEAAVQAAAERGGAWVCRVSPDPQKAPLSVRRGVDGSEVMGVLRIDRQGAVEVAPSNVLTGDETALRAEVSQWLEASLQGRANRDRENELIDEALWVKACLPAGDGGHAGRVIARSPLDHGRVSAWTRMSTQERQAADARANGVLQDLVGPNWAQKVSLHQDAMAPANVLPFSDIHLHLGGRSNGYGVDNPPGPRIEQMFQRSRERRGASVQDVMIYPVPDASLDTPYYMMQQEGGGLRMLELWRDGNHLVLEGGRVLWPDGRVDLAPQRFKESHVTDLNDGAIEWLARQRQDGRMASAVNAFVVPNRPLSWRGLPRSEATLREVLSLPEALAQRVKIGLIGGQMAHPLGVRHILQELAVAHQLDPSATKLHIVGGGELTGIKEGVSVNHQHQIDLAVPGNGLERQLDLYAKTGGLVVVHFDADNPSYLPVPNGGHLLISKTSGTQNLDALYATFNQKPAYRNVKIVHAHWGGLSRSAGPSAAHAHKIRALLEATPHVYIDTSWDAAGRRIFQDPHLARVYARLINDFPERFLSGSDEVAQMDNFQGAVRMQQESGFARLLDAPDALYTGNFAKIVGEAQIHMAAFRRANADLLVPSRLQSFEHEPVATTLARLRPFDEAQTPAVPAQASVEVSQGPGPDRAARRSSSPSKGYVRYASGVGLTAVSALGVHLLSAKTGLPLGDPALTNPLAFTLRGLLIGAKTRLTVRVQTQVSKLGADPQANGSVLDRLERLLVTHGALIGVRRADRALIRQAIADVRHDPLDAAGLGTLKGASGQLLSPRTAAGMADAVTRHVTFAYNLGNAGTSLSQHGWFQPTELGYWSTAGFAGANLLLSNNNFSAMSGGLRQAAAAGQAKIVQVGQAVAMSTFSLAAGSWAMHDFEPTVAGVAKSSLDLAFGVGAALQARNDLRVLRGAAPVTSDKLPHPLMILAGSLVAREAFDLNNYF